MGQKTHPTGFRIAITEPWRSRWYATKENFATYLVEDQKIRDAVKADRERRRQEVLADSDPRA